MSTQQSAVTNYVEAANGVCFAYRRIGKPKAQPLVMHIHFRANMDFWDPLLINTLAAERQVILFDNAGTGRSTGQVPATIQGWADDLICFAEALGLEKFDLLGFSMGGMTVQMVALTAHHLVRKLVIAGSTASAPSSKPQGIVWPREVAALEPFDRLSSSVTIEEGRDSIAFSFFPHGTQGQASCDEYWARLQKRNAEPLHLELLGTHSGTERQIAALMDFREPKPHHSFDRLGELKIPVLIANGDDDLLIPTSRSWELLTQIEDAQLVIYPKSGHGFLWQYAQSFAEDVNKFLNNQET